jgi:DNA modification methylase
MIDLRLGDCLDLMPLLPDASIDAVIADIPYGTTACKWDTVIPFAPMWEQLKRISRGAIVLFGSQPFTSALVASNLPMFRYQWVWDKNTPTGFLNAKRAPLKQHEDVCVFSMNGHTYNPQMEKKHYKGYRSGAGHKQALNPDGIYGHKIQREGDRSDYRYPKSIIAIQGMSGWGDRDNPHPTKKPVALMEYLIRTYTNEGATVLDFTMGSGTTGVAAVNTGRKFIGIEKDAGYFEIAQRRITEAQQQIALPMGIN